MREECSYARARIPRSATSSSPAVEDGCPSKLQHAPPDAAFSSASVEDGHPSQSQLGFDLTDLKLMHHYVTSTSHHLFGGNRQSHVWKHHIPTLAASNAALMHNILALAALHRARVESGSRISYRNRAFYHHGMGLPLFKRELDSASPETAEVIVASAALLGIWIYASPEAANEKLSLDDILSTVEIVRAGRSIFNLYKEFVITTPIGLFLIPSCRAPLVANQVSLTQQTLQALRNELDNSSDERAMCHLQMLMDQHMTGADHMRSSAGWMASVGEDYWARLRSDQPYSILVFAYSCLLAYASEHECWWMTGWSERILLACSEKLSPADKELVEWARHEELIRDRGLELQRLAKLGTEMSESSLASTSGGNTYPGSS
ncbi:hypothetical protein S7711_02370 [Stachybotrys chartarum IBT 7711]|uniref:Transcription factor domain-containing protein n=1 Tax=Stachybotrys chartarum (strain CBS 109288 / IBT 7711) TaxID=1280523 RepID=A0A084B135_STACB|nr:hypothetical protein S7711_02370 [Stachybotrys chartarum IBT 7711]